jgi:hypothetical protein
MRMHWAAFDLRRYLLVLPDGGGGGRASRTIGAPGCRPVARWWPSAHRRGGKESGGTGARLLRMLETGG